MLGSVRWSKEICVGGTEGAGRVMAVEQIGKVGGCLVVEGFVIEEENFELNLLGDGSRVLVWVSRRAAESWTY